MHPRVSGRAVEAGQFLLLSRDQPADRSLQLQEQRKQPHAGCVHICHDTVKCSFPAICAPHRRRLPLRRARGLVDHVAALEDKTMTPSAICCINLICVLFERAAAGAAGREAGG